MAAARAGSEFGKYQLTRLLGQGGMGEVFEAHDTTKDRTVALKILPEQLSRDEGFRTRFQRESRAAAMLEEPHVIPIHDWGEIDGNLYIDMRLVRGQDLHELLKAGPLEPERAVGIIRQVASALDAAQRALGGSPTSWPGTGPTAPTLAAPTRAPMTDPSGPTLAALNVPGHPDPIPQQVGGSQARPWLLPASIIAAAALILGGIGVVIGLLARPNSAPPTGAGSSNGHTIPAPSASQPTYHPEAPPISPTTPTVSPSSLTGRWSGPVSGDQSGFDVVAIIVDGGSLTATISYPQLNCGGTWTQRGFAGNGVRFVTEQITYGSCVTSEVTLAPQADGTLYFTSTYYAASKQRIFNTHAPLRRSTNE